MKEEKIRPIPEYILKLIKKEDLKSHPEQDGHVRFYSYYSTVRKQLVLITVAVKNRYKKWYCKQVVVHSVHGQYCMIKDICFNYIGGYSVGWHDCGFTNYRKWYESGNWDYQYDKYFNIRCPVINKTFPLKFEKYRYSAVDKYPHYTVLKYLKLYEQYPQAEMLIKFGLPQYATSVMILRKIGKDKAFRKWLIKHREELTYGCYVSSIYKAYKTGNPVKEIQRYERESKSFRSSSEYEPLREFFKGESINKFIDYITKQLINFSSYLDYFKACNYLHLDMTQEKNVFPHDFKRWHDIRIDEYHTAKAIADEQKRKELYEKFKVIAEKYLPLQRNLHEAFIVVIAKSPAELINEGNILHHCVGRMNYDQRMIREESLIFFIRNAAEPDIPFVTVEYSLANKKVLQCYGFEDSKPSEEVIEFVNKKWLPFANRKLNKITASTIAA